MGEAWEGRRRWGLCEYRRCPSWGLDWLGRGLKVRGGEVRSLGVEDR